MPKAFARSVVVAGLLSGSLALGVASPQPASAALVCFNNDTVKGPCLVANGNLTLEPILTSFPSYPSIPVNFVIAPNDGKIFVADKSGRVLMYPGRGSTTQTAVIDIRGEVMDADDRGLLGIALDPQYGTTSNYLYLLYTYDHDPIGGGSIPRWGGSGGGDACPTPPGGGTGTTGDGCVVTGRISRFLMDPSSGTVASGQGEDVIFDSNGSRGWCQQFPSHSIGTLVFGPDGKLYAGAGDSANYAEPDYGQRGGTQGPAVPANPCNDPITGTSGPWRGTLPAPSNTDNSEGGAFRAQSVRSTVSDGYQPLDGSIIRINKDGSIPSDNPLFGGTDAHGDDDAIVAYGMRNPFRFNFKPGTNDLWIGDVGFNVREEISHATVANGTVPNFGWPCYEGNMPSFDFGSTSAHRFSLCNGLSGTTTIPGSNNISSPLVNTVVAWGHGDDPSHYWDLYTDVGCRPLSTSPGSSSVGGAFVTATDWPAALNGAYVFGEYSRKCVWALSSSQQDGTGDPEVVAHQLTPIASKIAPVSIQRGPDGAIYVMDIGDSSVGRGPGLWRIGTASSPIARFTMDPASANPPVTVTFNASTSFVLPGRTVSSYAWDLTGDGVDDVSGTNPVVTRSYGVVQGIDIRLTVTDSNGQTSSVIQRLNVGSPPVIRGLTTSIGPAGYLENDTVNYTIDAVDPSSSPLVYTVDARMRHCATLGGTGCHEHFNAVGALPSTASGSFVAPGHAGYSDVFLIVTVTNAAGLTATQTFDLKANWLTLNVDTFPAGLTFTRDGGLNNAPYSTAQVGVPSITIATAAAQTKDGVTNLFTGWADAPAAGPSRVLAPAAGTVNLIAQFAAADGLTSTAPTRVLDTRVGTGAPAAIVPSQGVVQLDLRAAGVAATATAALLNVTVTGGSAAGFVTVYPCSQPRPLSSNLNYVAGQTVANLAQVALDGSGLVCLYAHGATHLVADLSGWFEPAGKAFSPVAPTRVLDTRVGTGAPVAPVAAQTALTLDLSSVAPAGAASVVLNLTSTDATADGFVTAYPCGGTRPLASNLNVRAGDVRPNQAVVALGAGATVCLYAHSTMNLVADLLGWYGSNGVKMATQSPERVLDTRDGTGGSTRLGAGGVVELNLTGQAPAGSIGVVLNVTGVSPSTDTFVTVYPCAAGRPLASNLNLTPNDIRPNLVTVPLDAAGKVCIYSQGPMDVVADLAGWAVNVA